jgi:hypothetical protein
MLDRLKSGGAPEGAAAAVEQYRAFCLMALGRQSDALQAVEAVVAADPLLQPNEGEVAPRVVAAFRDARRRLLPAIAQQRYQAAKGLYDRKDFEGAVRAFDATLQIMAAPDLAEASAQPPLSDLRTLITGFRDLAVAATPPPPPKPAAKPEAPPPPPPKAFYTPDDADVVPPAAVSQRVPPWPSSMASLMSKKRGIIEILVNEQGAIESAIMRQSINNFYDDMLLREARGWRYKPATRNNLPVKFKKMILINLQ